MKIMRPEPLARLKRSAGEEPPPASEAPPLPDVSFSVDAPSGLGLWSGVAIIVLIGALVVTVMWMVRLGCTPFGCH